jgi:uncharacterized membrane protein
MAIDILIVYIDSLTNMKLFILRILWATKSVYFYLVTLETGVLSARADTALYKFPQKTGIRLEIIIIFKVYAIITISFCFQTLKDSTFSD